MKSNYDGRRPEPPYPTAADLCEEQSARIAELEQALGSLLTALEPDETLPDWQNRAYLSTVAIPRAREALGKRDAP